MGEGLKQMYREVSSSRAEDEDELGESSSLSGESDDEVEDEANSPSNKSSSSSHGPLHELSSLVSQLPVKRGLSKFYQGKSQSFSSFSDVSSVEDLAKKESPIIKRSMKPCRRSYGGGLDGKDQESCYGSPSGPSNKILPKKGPRGSCASSIARTSSGCSYFAGGKPPAIPMHKNM
ncbi:uncharacterized protein A4U43_C05F26620 [Asparagus officinalis]|uniref:Oxidative stress 3 n=1 Tax=Asparagus officinalis TaxID=4686 RepID=A0A5P1EUP8_ASPOF|nr:uncharacterized protein LOC109840611 [Asparagus officinalis]ONK69778.1 uncharacterized protein A4U43_C05F26620 [Asparagus officinalis]